MEMMCLHHLLTRSLGAGSMLLTSNIRGEVVWLAEYPLKRH